VPAVVSRVVDLSHPVRSGMPVYPGDPEVAVLPHRRLAEDGYVVHEVCMGSQSGTHVDAPMHFISGGAAITDLPPERFLGFGHIVDCTGLAADEPVPLERLPEAGDLGPASIVLLHTGWSRHWGDDRYRAHPFLSAAGAEAILALSIGLIGIDALSVDPTSGNRGSFPAHDLLLGAGVLIAENLTGLAQVTWPNPFLSLLPLPLSGVDGAPVRAIAMELRDGATPRRQG